jgi:hypothetical protein
MAESRSLKLQLLADVSNLSKGLNQGANEVEGFGGKVAKFGKAAAAAFAVVAVAAAAFAVKFAKDAIVAGEAVSTANARILQINESMGLFGTETSAVTKELISYAEATARATGVDTNSIKATQAKLLTFKELAVTANEVGGQFERATKAAIDLGAAGFGTAELNAVALGKALNDPIKGISALSRNGITFTETEKARIETLVLGNKVGEAQIMILAAIEAQVGGTAEATANASDRMKVGYTQLQEKVGLFLLPVFEKLTAFVLDHIFPAFSKMSEALDGVGSKIENTFTPILENLVGFFRDNLVPIFQFWWGFISGVIIPGIVGTFTPILKALFEAFKRIGGTIKDNEENLKPLLTLFKAVASFVAKTLAPALGTILGAALKVIGVAISGLISGFSTLVGLIGSVVSGIRSMVALVANNPIVKGIGGLITNVFGGGRAAGGSVSSGTSYLVGEKGAEIFTPNQSGSIIPNSKIGGGGTVINLNVTGAIDPEGTARSIVSILNNSYYRGTSGAAALVS